MKTIGFRDALANELDGTHAALSARYEQVVKDVESGQLPDTPAMRSALQRMEARLGRAQRNINKLKGRR